MEPVYEDLIETLENYKTELEERGYTVLYVGLYGSQNYNLSDELSDVDARAVVLKDFGKLVRGERISLTEDFTTGQCDVKDLMTFAENVQKGNPAFIETVHTPYWVGDEQVRTMLQIFEVKPLAVYGTMMEKYKAIEKGLPTSSPFIETMGYDPKQLHHILRLQYELDRGLAHGHVNPLSSVHPMREVLMRIKRGTHGQVGKDFLVKYQAPQDKKIYKETAEAIPYTQKPMPNTLYTYMEEKYKEILNNNRSA